MFIYRDGMRDQTSFAPNYTDTMAAEREERAAAEELWNATRDLAIYRDNSTAQNAATAEAYARRIKAIHEATGVQIDNPALKPEYTVGPMGKVTRRTRQENEAEFRQALFDIAEAHPDKADVIGLDRPIEEDAMQVTRDSEAAYARAEARADAAGVGTGRQLATALGAGLTGSMRDPLQVAALFAGGGISAPGKTVAARVLQRIFTDAAINGGIEAGLQASSQRWREQAGVESGLGPALQQVGLSALFGGAFGGLAAGGEEVFRLLGRTAPEGALERVAAGAPLPEDVPAIARALDVQLEPQEARVAALGLEQEQLDAAAFGPHPPELDPIEAERLAAAAIREAEDPVDALPAPAFDPEQRYRQVERIVTKVQPLGRPPKKPIGLMRFLASEGGISDYQGELASIGLKKKFIPGAGPLVRKNGRSLDYAREAAAEAGYLDNLYGDPETAMQKSTVADLLDLLREEAGGTPVTSPRADGGREFAWLDYEQRQLAQESYRRLVQDVADAADTLKIGHQIDDAILIRAAEMVDDATDPVMALERAMEEDYRGFAAALDESGKGFSSEPEFDEAFDLSADPGRGPAAGADAGAAGQPDGRRGGGGADAPDRAEFPFPGDDQGRPFEPGSAQAADAASLTLDEARAPPPDSEFTEELGIWDAIPVTRDADGTVRHVTYADMIEDADRDDFLADLILSCKD